MRLRALAVTTALALAATGLSACTSKIGLAAAVGSSHLSLKTVDSYVQSNAVPYADQQGGQVIPRQNVVGTWVVDQLLQRAIVARQGKPLTKAQEAEAVNVIRTATGGDPVTVFAKSNAARGYTRAFSQLEVNQFEHLIALAHLVEPSKTAQQAFTDFQRDQGVNTKVITLLTDQKAHVTVNPRFGAWDAKNLGFSAKANAGLPSFVTIGPDTETSAAPAVGQ